MAHAHHALFTVRGWSYVQTGLLRNIVWMLQTAPQNDDLEEVPQRFLTLGPLPDVSDATVWG